MREFIETDELRNARFREVDLSGAEFRSVDLSNAKIVDAWLFNAEIMGRVEGLKINEVDVEPLIEAELDRRYPERTKLRPTDVAGLRVAFDTLEDLWAGTIRRARRLPAAALHERVNGEYSFVETQRHLVYGMDAWLTRMVLRVPNAYHEWGVPPGLPDVAPPGEGPGLGEVLDVRAERLQRVRDWLATAKDADLETIVDPPDPTGHPQESRSIMRCFGVVLREEWWHHRYATRDLEVLEGR